MSAVTLTVGDVDNMSDTELYSALKTYGFDVGPIVASTRGIYRKKLIEKIKAQPTITSPVPGLNSSIHDRSFHNDVLSHTVEKSSRNSVERPDSSNRYGDVNVHKITSDRKSFGHFTTASATYDDQGDVYELEEEPERYERHSPSKLSQSYTSYSRQSYEPSDDVLRQSRASEYGRSVGDRLTADYSDTRTGTVGGSYRSSLGGLGSTPVASSSYRSSLGESASARADRILEDIRRRSTISPGYKPLSETDRHSRTRDILEQARQSGRVSKSQSYGTQRSVLSEYLIKIGIGIVLFACIYFIITSMTQPSSFQAIDQEVNEILKDTEVDTE